MTTYVGTKSALLILKLATVLEWSASHSGRFAPKKSYPPPLPTEYHIEHTVLAATLRVSDRQLSGDNIPHAVNHSLALLRKGKELPETC